MTATLAEAGLRLMALGALGLLIGLLIINRSRGDFLLTTKTTGHDE